MRGNRGEPGGDWLGTDSSIHRIGISLLDISRNTDSSPISSFGALLCIFASYLYNTTMALRSFFTPLLIFRFFHIFSACTAFCLVASVQMYQNQYGIWSMVTWIMCFVVTIIIIILEQTGLSNKVPISWEDFNSAFFMLASLMLFTTSIVYPSAFLKGGCTGHICACMGAATAMSILCFFAYAIELGLTQAKSGENSGFLSTIPGLMKVFEAYVACVIFSLLPSVSFSPGLQWCVSCYSICFIIITLLIILSIGRPLPVLPVKIELVLISYNILSVVMYISMAYVWTSYFFRAFSRDQCKPGRVCIYDNGSGITSLTFINLVAYIWDTVYYFRESFFSCLARGGTTDHEAR